MFLLTYHKGTTNYQEDFVANQLVQELDVPAGLVGTVYPAVFL